VDPIILLIEDNPADAFLIREALRTHAVVCQLRWFSDSEEAVIHIEHFGPSQTPPDLVLLDLHLPKLDGKEVLGHIRRNPWLAQTPVAVLTSSDSPLDRREMARLGATCMLRKPATLDEFLGLGGTFKGLLKGTLVA
jgi:CheY-like chemotaxis protein